MLSGFPNKIKQNPEKMSYAQIPRCRRFGAVVQIIIIVIIIIMLLLLLIVAVVSIVSYFFNMLLFLKALTRMKICCIWGLRSRMDTPNDHPYMFKGCPCSVIVCHIHSYR